MKNKLLKEDDIYLIHGYGDRDGRPVFLRVDERGVYNWTPHRQLASEFNQFEACAILADSAKANRKAWAIRNFGSVPE